MKKRIILLLAVALIGMVAFVGCGKENQTKEEKLKVSILIPGKHTDGGFMEAAYRGYEQVEDELDVDVDYISNVSAISDIAVLTDAMRELAKKGPDMIIGHGGQCNVPAETISKEFPEIKF